MVFTLENTVRAGRRLLRVTDANGLDWTYLRFVRIDDVTGEVEYLVGSSPNGGYEIDPVTNEVRRKTMKLTAPLLVQFKQIT